MKRDFQEEYQNYIESDMPDLWSRIEPNLREKSGKPEEEKKQEEEKTKEEGQRQEEQKKEERRQEEEKRQGEKKAKQAKVIYFLKRAVPAAAGLCLLIIGIGVMKVQKSSDMAPMATESGEQNDAGMAYEPEMEEAEAAEEEFVMTDESFDDGDFSADDYAASAEESAEDTEKNMPAIDSAGGADKNQNRAEAIGSLTETAEDSVEIEWAMLSKIAVASEEMQEMGYVYAYTFRLEDGSSLKVYLTKEQCDDIEEREIEIKRKETYSLWVYPFNNPETDGGAESGEGFLEKIEKLP